MIYLDHAATTPVPRPVADAMYQVLTEQFGNPSSQYPLGREAKALVEDGRAVVAGALGCRPENLHFTSCLKNPYYDNAIRHAVYRKNLIAIGMTYALRYRLYFFLYLYNKLFQTF